MAPGDANELRWRSDSWRIGVHIDATIVAEQPPIEITELPRESCVEADDFGVAVESQKRDNLALGQTLVSFGLMGVGELSKVEVAQRDQGDVVESLLVSSTIRSRLGEILLKAKHITSSQLERALEIQRAQGGLLGAILVDQGWLVHRTLNSALAEQVRGDA